MLYNFFISEEQIMKEITKNIYNVGASSHNVDLFESHFVVPNGMAYNSYLIIDEKITLIDGVDELVVDELYYIKGINLFTTLKDALEAAHDGDVINLDETLN